MSRQRLCDGLLRSGQSSCAAPALASRRCSWELTRRFRKHSFIETSFCDRALQGQVTNTKVRGLKGSDWAAGIGNDSNPVSSGNSGGMAHLTGALSWTIWPLYRFFITSMSSTLHLQGPSFGQSPKHLSLLRSVPVNHLDNSLVKHLPPTRFSEYF